MSGAGFLGHGQDRGRREPAPLGPPIFLEFFYKLRARGIRVGPNEWFALLEALERGLAGESLAGFYHLARAVLVKSEAKFDAYDLAFAEFFRGLTLPDAVAAAIELWLAEGLPSGVPLEQILSGLGPLELEQLLRQAEGVAAARAPGEGEGEMGRGAGGKSALRMAERRTFRDYRSDRTLDVRQLRVALRKLRDLVREGALDELDLEETIERTGKNAGEIDLAWRRPRHNRVRLLLLMDTGGSMEPYVRLSEALFSAASQERHWRGFRHYYFHNCVYTYVYKDGAFRERVAIEKLLQSCDAEWKLVVVGDACMAMSELLSWGGSIDWFERERHEPGVEWLRRLSLHFRRAVWLNPMPRTAWDHPSVRSIGVLFPMFELTVDGLDAAVKALKGQA